MTSINDDRRQKSELERKAFDAALPRTITLLQSNLPTIGMISVQCRSFHTTSTRFETASRDDPDNPTFRQRLRAGARQGAQRGQVMAKKGANTVSAMIRQYGPVFVVTYGTVYFTFLGTLFLGIDSGMLDPAKILHFFQGTVTEGADTPKSTVHMVVEILEHYSWTAKYAPIVEKNPHVANLAVAWIAIKFTEPIRLALTLAVVPRLARYFGFVPKKVVEGEEDVEDVTTEQAATEMTAAGADSSSSTKDQLEKSGSLKEAADAGSKPIGDEIYAEESKKAQKNSL